MNMYVPYHTYIHTYIPSNISQQSVPWSIMSTFVNTPIVRSPSTSEVAKLTIHTYIHTYILYLR